MQKNKMKNDSIKVKAVKKENLTEKIISEIKSLIDEGQITPGSKLPGEVKFARMLGVSRPSLREAFKALSALGIIVNKQGSGNFLSSDHDDWSNEPLSIFFSLKKGALIDIYEARKGMEMHAVALAAKRRTVEDLKEIEAALKKMQLAANDKDKFFKYDLAFHSAISSSTKNKIIIDLLRKMHKLTIETRRLPWGETHLLEANTRKVLLIHEKLFEVIAAGDADAATIAISQHLDDVMDELREMTVRA